jgi:hypothetical protein
MIEPEMKRLRLNLIRGSIKGAEWDEAGFWAFVTLRRAKERYTAQS